jgi:predicted PurR-regulated permease PerM
MNNFLSHYLKINNINMEMMITVLVSAVSTLVFSYIVWLIIGVHKLKKQQKEQLELNKYILEELESIRRYYDNRFDEYSKELESIQNNIYQNINDIDNRFHNFYNLEYLTLSDNVGCNDKNVRKDIDRRFDTVYKKIQTLTNN